ncbi:hypothetical protein AAON49_07860 [Pseudotenacibaculum sp. MALMAid0570]|uniref:hypothetical protein n=1 Tax=Pseudotenacibaculum sp. MALMAid0570 TaxID=3143938 RepID=UPI0032DEDAD3
MKKLKLTITAIALCFATLTAFANETEPLATKSKNELRSEIVSILGTQVPSYLVDNSDIKANVSLIVNNQNQLIIVSVDTKSNTVDKYLKSKLNYQKVNVKGLKKGEIYRVPLTIKQS